MCVRVCLGEGEGGLLKKPDMVSGGSYISNDLGDDPRGGGATNSQLSCWRRPPAEASSPPRCPSRTPPLRNPWQEL